MFLETDVQPLKLVWMLETLRGDFLKSRFPSVTVRPMFKK